MKKFFSLLLILFFSFTSYSQCTTCALGCGPGCGCAGTFCVPILPVHLISFDVKEVNNIAEIIWITQAEKNVSKFVVESGPGDDDRNIQFSVLQEIPVSGKSSEEYNRYIVRDSSFYAGTQERYYRLMEYDLDGTVINLGTRHLKQSASSEIFLTASPVPFENELTLSFNTGIPSTAEITIYSFFSQALLTRIADQGTTEVSFSTAELPAGIYFVAVKTGSFYKVIKVVK